jgi:hypothetical protein
MTAADNLHPSLPAVVLAAPIGQRQVRIAPMIGLNHLR